MESAPPASQGPRFRPEGSDRSTRWIPTVVALAAVILGAVVTLGWPASGMKLRCEDGLLHAEARSLLGRNDELASLPPVPTSAGRCADVSFGSRAELEARWTELALIAVDDALITDDEDRLDRVGPILDAVARLESGPGPDRVESRRRALLVARLRADVNAARGSQLRARARLQEARDAGVDPELLAELEEALGGDPPPPTPPPTGPGSGSDIAPAAPPAEPPADAAERQL